MNKQYERIDFNAFTNIAEEPLTAEEKGRIMEQFYRHCGAKKPGMSGITASCAAQGGKGQLCREGQSQKEGNTRRQGRPWKKRRFAIAAACVCLIACTAVTPVGEKAWAAVKEAFVGIGAFLGMEQQDDYATIVNQTRHKNGITATLETAIGSDRSLRYSIYAERDDGKKISGGKVYSGDLWINEEKVGTDIESAGNGAFGGPKPNQEGMFYMDFSYFDYEMPLNPEIKMTVDIEGTLFTYEFTLKNETFKAATKEIPIDRTIPFRDQSIELDRLIITPIDQVITTKNDPDDFDVMSAEHPVIWGTDSFGNKVIFSLGFDGRFIGYQYSDDDSYQLNYNISSYTFQIYDEAKTTPQDLFAEEAKVGGSFTVKIDG